MLFSYAAAASSAFGRRRWKKFQVSRWLSQYKSNLIVWSDGKGKEGRRTRILLLEFNLLYIQLIFTFLSASSTSNTL
jgi:hypothetical protein